MLCTQRFRNVYNNTRYSKKNLLPRRRRRDTMMRRYLSFYCITYDNGFNHHRWTFIITTLRSFFVHLARYENKE